MPNLINDSNVHYVKFMRGSAAAWATLQATPTKINNDTLYFIYENAETSTQGKLYLGQKLISGVGEGNVENININDIGDIYIDNETLSDKQILVYNDTSHQWENAALSTIINTAVGVMQGATASTDGISGLVPIPQRGDQNKFLKGNGTWATINIPTFNTDVFNLQNNEVNLNGFDLAEVGSIPIKTNNGLEWTKAVVGSLNYQITTLEKLQAQLSGVDPEPINTNTIYMINNGNDSSTQNIYDEYMVINNNLEHLGTLGQVNLENYVTIPTFNTTISSLNNILYDTTDENTGEITPGLISRVSTIELNYVNKADNDNLVEEVNSLSDRLRWHELQNV